MCLQVYYVHACMDGYIRFIFVVRVGMHARLRGKRQGLARPSSITQYDALREQVTKEARGWAYLFRKMQEAKVTFDLADYGVSQTSLEQASLHCDCALDASRSVCSCAG